MQKIFILLSLTIFLLPAGCRDTDEEAAELFFRETQCANPWDSLVESEGYLTDIRNYLESEGIVVWAIGRELVEEVPTCQGCTCPTGNIIVIRVPEDQVSAASEIGFDYLAEGM